MIIRPWKILHAQSVISSPEGPVNGPGAVIRSLCLFINTAPFRRTAGADGREATSDA